MTEMSFEEIFIGFVVAIAAGALIGLERQQDKDVDQRLSLGGVRTFPLIALAGALAALVSHAMGIGVIIVALFVTGAFLSIAYHHEWTMKRAPGITTPLAALITFILGALALLPGLPLDRVHRYLLIVASASVVMALLSFKEPLHRAITHLSDDDIYATAKFVILALVVLPLLPNLPMGPYAVWNPFRIGLMVVLIAAISFLGYVLTRIVGPKRGLTTTGILGGLVSSTAVTLGIAHHVRHSPDAAALGALSILGASSTMFARMLVIVAIINPLLLPALLWPLGTMLIAGFGGMLLLYVTSQESGAAKTPITHRNPFELRSALQFGALYAIVLVIAKWGETAMGHVGLLVSSTLAGVTDVDAITLSIMQFHQEGLLTQIAATAVTLAALTNTAVKGVLAAWIGGLTLGRQIAPTMVAMLSLGILVLTLTT